MTVVSNQARRQSAVVLAATFAVLALALALLAPVSATAQLTQVSASTSGSTGGLFVPSAGRLLNTMNGVGGYSTPMVAGGWRTVSPLGTNGIPTSGVSAVQLALVAVTPTTNGSVQVRPSGTTPAATTSLYYSLAVTGSQTNTTIIELGTDGTFQVKADTSINLLIDVEGYFTTGATTAAGGYVPLRPTERIVDTRSGLGLPQARLVTGSTTTIDIAGLSEVPEDATAVFVNFEVVNRSAQAGHIQPYASGTPRVTAGLSFPASVTTSISGTIPLGTDVVAGKMDVYLAGGPIDLLVNVVGFYTSTEDGVLAGQLSSNFISGTARLLSGYTLPGQSTTTIAMAGQSGMPSVSEGLTAAALNVQIRQDGTTGGGHIGMWPDDETNPNTTVLNYQPGTVRSNFTTVAVGSGGGVILYNGGTQSVTVYLDLQGWYVGSTSTPPPGLPAGVSSGEVEDLTRIAASEGISILAAYERYNWQTAFAVLADNITSMYPNDFASAAIYPNASTPAAIYFANSVPQGVPAQVANFNIPVTLVPGAGFSELQVQEEVSAAHYAYYDTNPSLSITTEYNDSASRIEVSILASANQLAPNGQLNSTFTQGMNESAQIVESEAAGIEIPVSVNIVPDQPGEGANVNDTVRGGAILTLPGKTSLYCTSGFSVRNKTNTQRGVLTADHCDERVINYSGRAVLTRKEVMAPRWGDVRYLYSTEHATNQYYRQVGQYRDITQFGRNPPVGARLCKFGRNTGESCDSVRKRNTCRGKYCGLSSTTNRNGDGGDSGGPWYYSNVAYGIHSGGHWSMFAKRDQFTPLATQGFENMPVTILTSR